MQRKALDARLRGHDKITLDFTSFPRKPVLSPVEGRESSSPRTLIWTYLALRAADGAESSAIPMNIVAMLV